MTTEVIASGADAAVSQPNLWQRLVQGRTLPLLTVIAIVVAIWYVACIPMNYQVITDRYEREDTSWTASIYVRDAWSYQRPILPAPHQIVDRMVDAIFFQNPTSRRSLIFHARATGEATLAGFVLAAIFGILLAAGIVFIRTLDKSVMPWVITSQTIPILAIAPMVIVALGSMGVRGLIPKAIISLYLGFFPIVIGMTKGLRSPTPLQIDLMRTYSANRWQVFRYLRWPASVPFLFTSLKVGIAISLVGAIVAELPTGAQAGLGAALLSGSQIGDIPAMWAALFTAAFLAMAMIGVISLAEIIVLRRTGARK